MVYRAPASRVNVCSVRAALGHVTFIKLARRIHAQSARQDRFVRHGDHIHRQPPASGVTPSCVTSTRAYALLLLPNHQSKQSDKVSLGFPLVFVDSGMEGFRTVIITTPRGMTYHDVQVSITIEIGYRNHHGYDCEGAPALDRPPQKSHLLAMIQQSACPRIVGRANV